MRNIFAGLTVLLVALAAGACGNSSPVQGTGTQASPPVTTVVARPTATPAPVPTPTPSPEELAKQAYLDYYDKGFLPALRTADITKLLPYLAPNGPQRARDIAAVHGLAAKKQYDESTILHNIGKVVHKVGKPLGEEVIIQDEITDSYQTFDHAGKVVYQGKTKWVSEATLVHEQGRWLIYNLVDLRDLS